MPNVPVTTNVQNKPVTQMCRMCRSPQMCRMCRSPQMCKMCRNVPKCAECTEMHRNVPNVPVTLNVPNVPKCAEMCRMCPKMLELPMPKYPRHAQAQLTQRRKVKPPCLSDFKELLHHLRSGGSFLQGTANMSHNKAVCKMHPVLFLDIQLLHNFNACV